jgi:hypothetical protein
MKIKPEYLPIPIYDGPNELQLSFPTSLVVSVFTPDGNFDLTVHIVKIGQLWIHQPDLQNGFLIEGSHDAQRVFIYYDARTKAGRLESEKAWKKIVESSDGIHFRGPPSPGFASMT